MTDSDVFFSEVSEAHWRRKLCGGWVYWREGDDQQTLRLDQRGLVFEHTGGDAQIPGSYRTRFITETGKVVNLAYSQGPRPAGSRVVLDFVERTVTQSLSASEAQTGPLYVNAGGQTTPLRALPISEIRLPRIKPLAVGVVSANVPRPAQSGPRAMAFLLHTFAAEHYAADFDAPGDDDDEFRFHRQIPAHTNRALLVTRTEAIASDLGTRNAAKRRVIWAVGHGFAGEGNDEAAFDMTASARNTPNRVFSGDIRNVVQLIDLRENHPEQLEHATIPRKTTQLDAELGRVRTAFETHAVSELVLYGCQIASSFEGRRLCRNLAQILSTPNNPVRVGAYTSLVVAAEFPNDGAPGHHVEVALTEDHDHSDDPDTWTEDTRSADTLKAPQYWSDDP